MEKPNFIKSLFQYFWICISVPFYWVFVPNRNSKFSWTPWQRVAMFFVFLLFWWILAPLYAIQDYKRDKKIYEKEMATK